MIELNSRPVTVTVYPDQARVTRQATVALEPGKHQLVIKDLPLTLLPDSVRASGRGTAQARLLGVDVTITFYTAPPRAQVTALQERIQALEDQDALLANQAATLENQQAFLKKLGESTAEQLARGIAFGKAGVEQGGQVMAFVQERSIETGQALQDVRAKRRDLARELNKLRNELQALQSAQPPERYTAAAEIEVLAPGDFTLELTYVVNAAAWQPLYDLRLTGDREPQVDLTYLGQVIQQTGEDWTGVALTLSTARPAVSAVVPELRPWTVSQYLPPPERPRPMAAPPTRGMRAMAEEAVGEMVMAAAVPAVEEVELEAVSAEVIKEGAAITFKVPRPVTVPSDGSPHKTTIATLNLPPDLEYVSVPKLVQQAFHRATIVNTSDYVLLPGQANIFHGGEFLGTTPIPRTVAPAQQFTVSLGPDDRVRVERELEASGVDKKFLGNTRRLSYTYKLTLQSLRERPVRVVVRDQVPVSRHEDIKVKLDWAEPTPDEHTEMGLLRWQRALAPNETWTIRFGFSVEHPKEMRVVGLE